MQDRFTAVLSLTDDVLDSCQSTLGYRFSDLALLRRCLTHASASRTRLESNERLEFLGDAVLGVVVCEALYDRYPDAPEGELTRIKSEVVSRSTCARMSRKLGLDDYLLLGKGISAHGRIPGSVSAAVFEALIGGIYLDGGFDAARAFVLRCVPDEIGAVAGSPNGVNFKSLLQQQSQREFGETPVYTVLDEKGPDHLKCFKVSARVGARLFSPAWGPSKKEAEQRAAQNALAQIGGIEIPNSTD
ncbi:MAG: ribonuclease III [Planctomyces sp.]|nr:ribonuclease III [Planctomyces sp.]